MSTSPGDIVMGVALLGLTYMLFVKSGGYKLIDPGLVGVEPPLPDLQIEGETPSDMSGYTEVNALNGPETDKLLIAATRVLREKTKLCWQPIATQYATSYTNPTTDETIIKSRITFSEVNRFFARDYDIATKDGEVVYIQTQSGFFDDPKAPQPYNRKDIYHKSVPSSIVLLNEMNA